jgi:hypothetical protein
VPEKQPAVLPASIFGNGPRSIVHRRRSKNAFDARPNQIALLLFELIDLILLVPLRDEVLQVSLIPTNVLLFSLDSEPVLLLNPPKPLNYFVTS